MDVSPQSLASSASGNCRLRSASRGGAEALCVELLVRSALSFVTDWRNAGSSRHHISYIYICIYMYMYMYMYIYVYIYVYMYICIYVYMYICIYVYMYICIYVYMYICIYVYMYICIYVYMYTYIYINIYILYIYLFIYLFIIYTYIFVYNIYLYTYIYNHIKYHEYQIRLSIWIWLEMINYEYLLRILDVRTYFDVIRKWWASIETSYFGVNKSAPGFWPTKEGIRPMAYHYYWVQYLLFPKGWGGNPCHIAGLYCLHGYARVPRICIIWFLLVLYPPHVTSKNSGIFCLQFTRLSKELLSHRWKLPEKSHSENLELRQLQWERRPQRTDGWGPVPWK